MPGGQGSSGSGGSGGDSGDSGDGYERDLEDVIADALAGSEGTRPFGWIGSDKTGRWNDTDYEKIDAIVVDINELQTRGEIKSDKAIKQYLNGLMEDNGITLAQYEALKLYYGIE